jgi:uncharacterized protein YbaP (TraB family)
MKSIALTLLLTLGTSLVSAETSVWKVEKNNATVYLGGTIHVLRPSDFPLPKEFEQANAASQILTFEIDLGLMNSPKIISEMISKLSYSDERTIKSELSEETYQQLNQYALSVGISLEFMKKAKPAMLMLNFTMVELQKMGALPEGVDMFFYKQARKQSKKTDFLETPQDQFGFLAELGVGDEENFYKKLLKDFQNTQEIFSKMIDYWRLGDNEQLNLLVNDTMKKDSPNMYQSMLVDRNHNWMPKIEEYFKTTEVEFILVGAAHMIGEDGLINLLQQKGYKVSKL